MSVAAPAGRAWIGILRLLVSHMAAASDIVRGGLGGHVVSSDTFDIAALARFGAHVAGQQAVVDLRLG